MSPAPFHPKTTEITTNLKKTSRFSHSIKKTSSLSSNKPQQQQRQPVIIYTHSPKIIETHPRDFMQLVQKLTGLSHGDRQEEEDEDDNNRSSHKPPQPKQEPTAVVAEVQYPKKEVTVCKEEIMNETSSLIAEENNNYGYSCMGEVKSCFMTAAAAPPIMMEPPMIPYVRRLPVFAPTNSAEFMCSNKPFLTYVDPLFF